MNAPGPTENRPVDIWQQANEDRLRRNAQQWVQSRDTTLFTEEWEGYYVAVTREGSRLILWMLDADVANTDWIQSAMDLAEPLRLQSSYTQAMVLSLLWQPLPQKLFLSGLGGGCLATTLHHHLIWADFVCVEIASPIATAASRFFGFQEDERMSLVVSDVRDFLEQDSSEYDIMYLDVFCDHGVTPSHATEMDFLALCRARIRARGLLAMNLGNHDPAFMKVVDALHGLFQTVYTCRGRGSTSVLFATDQPPRPHAQLMKGAEMLRKRHDFLFALPPWIARLTQLQPPNPEHLRDPIPPSADEHSGASEE